MGRIGGTEREGAHNSELSMLIDVVISTRNNESEKKFSLYYVIRSLLSQNIDNINIIIADNGSFDKTKENIRDTFGQKVNLIDTSGVSGNISASRNEAARCGRSDLIFFLDDDTILKHSNDLEKCVKVSMEVDFACGARRRWAPLAWPELIRTDDPVNKVTSTLECISNEPISINRISGKNIIDNRSYLANFGSIKRTVFESIRGFDEAYVGWGYQDTDLMWRLCVDGYKYDLFFKYDIEIFHLSHKVDKGANYEVNRQRFLEKQRLDGRFFHTNHFFEIYEHDGYSLFSDFPSENKS